MSRLTDDPRDPDLLGRIDDVPAPPARAYLVLPFDDRASGFIRPFRTFFIHDACGTRTTMHREIAETIAVEPRFYAVLYCQHCRKHRPIGEFHWADGKMVGA